MNSKVLTKAGLTESEAKVYTTLIKFGEGKAHEIMKETGMQGSVVYPSLDRLISLGLVSYITKNNVKYFYVDNVKRIKEIMQENLKEVDNFLDKIKKVKTKKQESGVRIYEGLNGLRTVLNYRVEESKKGDTILVINTADIHPLEKYRTLFKNNELKRVKKGVRLKIITNKKYKDIMKKEYSKLKLREDRFTDLKSPTGCIIYNDYVVLSIFEGEEQKPRVFLIKSKGLVNTYKQYFNILWKQARP